MEDLRKKFIVQNLEKAKRLQLTQWEKEFIENIESLIRRSKDLTQRQFNTLKTIADR